MLADGGGKVLCLHKPYILAARVSQDVAEGMHAAPALGGEGDLLLGGLASLFPRIQTVMADAGHESKKLARELFRENRWKLQIVKRRQRAFKITGLTWIVERSFAWLGRNRRFSKDYEYRVQTSETMLDIAATRAYAESPCTSTKFFKHPLCAQRPIEMIAMNAPFAAQRRNANRHMANSARFAAPRTRTG